METKYVSEVYNIPQDKLNQFAEASGGTGKIHIDPEYASQTSFGGTLVHGVLLFALIEKELEFRFPDWHQKGTLKATFVKPVRAGADFVICLEQNQNIEMDVTVICEEKTVVSGKAFIAK
ncbi:hypothetical protein ELQ35_01595 [Peribacillus cavernae]|uniref:MaoC-like domain-containing protein n=1 Tax=Peribacillus cavernae TaxID=1674310 RepID=A0A3S1BCF1_9BACI|nr:MaoC family dehydratase [Peribacillus cavernae]MDQ0218029.1 acyl dehydratase [Peribacillus cavernae]RUQ32805.1 hypothetical protein ELQ35_01595 [Peribacillus cavernae]